ncbi:MAG: SGNH/GDSL hydrolase family protein [Thermoanaerobaculia bacterium]
MRRNHYRSLLAALALVAVALPTFAQRGSADFTRYVVIGDSYGAGVSNASVVISHQIWSYPSVIARQVGIPICGPDPACIGFQQPLVSEPGIGPELELRSIIPSVVIAPKSTQSGVPLNLNLPRPYNNLSVPGFRVGHLLTVTGTEQGSGAAQFILRGLGTSVQQALALQPTFMTIWIGGNDVLAGILAGTPAVMTPIDDFAAAYETMLDTLIAGAPNAGIVVGTIPDPLFLPFAQTIPPVLINPVTGEPLIVEGDPIFFFGDLGGGELGQLPPGSLLTLNALAFLRTGHGIPAALAPFFPPLPNIGQPLPDSVILTPTESAAIRERAAQITETIRSLAGERNIPVVDFQPFFDEIVEGIDLAGIKLDASFITGGIFSLDGFHLTDIGYTLFANEFIETINEAYDTDIPLAPITPFFQNNAPIEELGFIPPGTAFSITDEGLASIMSFAPSPAPDSEDDDPAEPTRRRTIRRGTRGGQ